MTTEKIIQRITVARYARGLSRKVMYAEAGTSDVERNWKYHNQTPTLTTVDKIAGALAVDPAWLAYGDKPQPSRAKGGYHVQPANRLSPKMETVFSAWEEDGLGLPLFEILEQTGLINSIYILGTEEGQLKYDHIGTVSIHTLGADWWKNAPGKFIHEDDADIEFASSCLENYLDSMGNNVPRRDKCESISFYTGEPLCWTWDRLIAPCEDNLSDRKMLVVNEIGHNLSP